MQLVLASNFDRRVHPICEGHRNWPLSRLASFRRKSGSTNRLPLLPALAERAELAPREILMVGDDWENDIIGAMESGLEVVYLDRSLEVSEQKLRIAKTISSLTELLDLLP